MPMELTNAFATFQKIINQVLYHKLDYMVMVYLDNILIYTKGTRKVHKKEIQKVLQLLKKNNIWLNKDKSKFT